MLTHAPLLVVTKGEKGCTIHTEDGSEDVPAVTPDRIADPTGVGDAFRGGFMKGLAMGARTEVRQARQRSSDLCLEHLGGTSHAYVARVRGSVTSSTSAH